jgi:DNA-binding transcriptional LysR family regulator
VLLSKLDRHTHRMIQFLAVARGRSIHAAAETLNIAQPTLTKSMAHLESLLGVPLFDRSSSGVSLTKYGDVLRRYAEEMEAALNHAELDLNYLQSGKAGSFRIAAGSVWLNLILPKVAAALQRHAGKPVMYTNQLEEDGEELLIRNEIDIMCGSTEHDLAGNSNFEFLPKARYSGCMIVRKNHPLLKMRGDTQVLSKATKFPLVRLSQGVRSHRILAEAFRKLNLSYPRVAMDTSSPSAMFSLLEETDFVGFAPEPLITHMKPKGLASVPIRSSAFQITKGVTYRRSLSHTGLFKILLAEIDTALDDLKFHRIVR